MVALGGFAINVEVFACCRPAARHCGRHGGTYFSQAGYLASAYALSFAVGSPLLTSIFAASDRRTVLSVAAAVFSVLTPTAALSTGYWQLFVARMALGFSAGLFAALALATASALATSEGRGRVISIVLSGQTAAIAFGVPLAALTATNFGWRVSYSALTICGSAWKKGSDSLSVQGGGRMVTLARRDAHGAGQGERGHTSVA